MSTRESIVISDVLLKPESRGNGRLLAAPVVYHNLPKRGRCRLVGQTLPEQVARQGENSVCTYKQETFHIGITMVGLTVIDSETDQCTWCCATSLQLCNHMRRSYHCRDWCEPSSGTR